MPVAELKRKALPKPYVGITGFMKPSEVDEILPLFDGQDRRLFMIGVLVSSKTLAGQQNKYPNRYPVPNRIAPIFTFDPLALNLIHYSTDQPDRTAEHLHKLTLLGGPHLRGFQLNMNWPDAVQIAAYAERMHPSRLVLQIGARALEAVGHNTAQLVANMGRYVNCVSDVLIDPSGGKGIPFEVKTVRPYLRALRDAFPALGLGVAGGLGPETLTGLTPLLAEFPDLSINATDDHLLLDYAKAYARQAIAMAVAKR